MLQQVKGKSIITSMYVPPDLEYSYGTIRFTGEYNKPFTLNFLNIFDWNTVLQTKPQLGMGLGLIEISKLHFMISSMLEEIELFVVLTLTA